MKVYFYCISHIQLTAKGNMQGIAMDEITLLLLCY